VPKSKLVEVSGKNLSLLGTDTQLVTGDYGTAGEWALRFMRHPLQIAGIYYPSRHDNDRFNVALFKRPHLLEQIEDADLLPANVKRWKRRSRRGLVYGPPVLVNIPDLTDGASD
jgi:hypothetical protein